MSSKYYFTVKMEGFTHLLPWLTLFLFCRVSFAVCAFDLATAGAMEIVRHGGRAAGRRLFVTGHLADRGPAAHYRGGKIIAQCTTFSTD